MKIAVHFHLYYQTQLPEMLKLLTNLNQPGINWDLYVTLPLTDSLTDAQAKAISNRILSIFPNAKITHPENRGYDVGAFIDFLHHINLDEYDYVLKVHTKNQNKRNQTILNGNKLDNALWRKILLDALLITKKQIHKNLALLSKNPQIGMLGAKYCLTNEKHAYQELLPEINAVLSQMSLPPVTKVTFVAGTMFLCKASLLKPLRTLSIADFSPTNGKVRDKTLAHVIERAFGAIIEQQNYQLRGIPQNHYAIKFLIKRYTRFFYQKKHTKSGKTIIKICKLPVYSQRSAA
ncbi:MAG: hypothetical protein J6J35_01130 [Alphaproteobacteria bacterium]|nr:hypothetical protein [Alphaproteobacteria bacterium]